MKAAIVSQPFHGTIQGGTANGQLVRLRQPPLRQWRVAVLAILPGIKGNLESLYACLLMVGFQLPSMLPPSTARC